MGETGRHGDGGDGGDMKMGEIRRGGDRGRHEDRET